MTRIMRERGTPFTDGELVSLGGKFPVKVVDIDAERARREYTVQAGQYYDDENYEVQQVLVPDRNGRFPGEPEVQAPFSDVPILRTARH
jgi:hypothetical protein